MPAQADLDLAVNCGSSSIKFALYHKDTRAILVSGSAANVQGDQPATYTFKHAPASSDAHEGKGKGSGDGPELSESQERKLEGKTSYQDIFTEILKDVTREEVLGPEREKRIRLVAHRIVHGGTADGPIVIRHGDKDEKEVLDRMEEVSSFAPLHVRPLRSVLSQTRRLTLLHVRRTTTPCS